MEARRMRIRRESDRGIIEEQAFEMGVLFFWNPYIGVQIFEEELEFLQEDLVECESIVWPE